MDAAFDPDAFNWKKATVSAGHVYRYIDQGPSEKEPLVVILCLHGFPDLAIGWRYPILALVKSGYRVIAPDLLGYGGTSKPTEIEPYAKLAICKSLCEILDQENVTEEIGVIGHDWGAVLAGNFVRHFSKRVKFWVTLCVPPSVISAVSAEDVGGVNSQRFTNFGYQEYFRSQDANDELTRYCKTFLLMIYLQTGKPLESSILQKIIGFKSKDFVLKGALRKQVLEYKDTLEQLPITSPELRYYLKEFQQGGMQGPLNWYKTLDLDQQNDKAANLPPGFPQDIPYLFIAASEDRPLPPSLFPESLKNKYFPDGNIVTHTIEGADHFMMEDPVFKDTVNSIILSWLKSHDNAAHEQGRRSKLCEKSKI